MTCRNTCANGDHERPPMGMGGGDDDFGGVGGMRGGKMRRGEGMPPGMRGGREIEIRQTVVLGSETPMPCLRQGA
ncbi:MAG: hypothetical protein IPP40_17085 [bacterium]|nr:hypothetical protein [bacterium]